MGAAVISVFMIIGFAVSAALIRAKWNYYARDNWPFRRLDLLRQNNALSGVWPEDNGFASLQFSLLRHLAAGLLSVFLLFRYSDGLLPGVIFWADFIYAVAKIPLYRARKKDWALWGDASRALLAPVKSACFVVVVYAFYIYALCVVCYCIMP